jgi:hypothetical protein
MLLLRKEWLDVTNNYTHGQRISEVLVGGSVCTRNLMIVTKPVAMTYPGSGIYVVQGEIAILLTAMKRGARWSLHSHQVGMLS